MNVEISIVVPIYNVEDYIEKCIVSLTKQVLKNIEIILVDDGSNDNSGKICDQYAKKDERIRVIHKKNGGLSDARNVGIESARGTYLAFIDGDDVVCSNMFSEMHKAALEENADIVVCGYQVIDDNKPMNQESLQSIEVMNHDVALMELFQGDKFFVSAWGKLYKRELFDNIRYPYQKIHEDMFTTYKVFDKAKKIVFIDAKLYGYVIRHNSITHCEFSEKRFDNLEALKEIMLYFSNAGEQLKNVLYKRLYIQSLYILNMICACKFSWKTVKYYSKYREFVIMYQQEMLSCDLLDASDKTHVMSVVQRGVAYCLVYKYRETLERFTYTRIKNKIKKMLFNR